MSWQDLRAIAKALEQARPHPEEHASACVSKDEPRLMVRDGAHAPPHHEETRLRRLRPHDGPADRAAAAGGRSPSIRRRAALPAPGRETAARYRAAACLTVSDARQTTTPPVSVEFRDRQPRRPFRRGVEQQMRTPGVHRDEARQLRIAGHRAQPLVGAPLKTVAEEMRDRVRRQRGRHFGRCRSTAGTAWSRSPRARARRARPPRPCAARRCRRR